MKKHIYTFLVLLFSLTQVSVKAQQGFYIDKEISANNIHKPNSTFRIEYDTLTPGSQDSLGFGFCGDTMKIYKLNLPAHGYIGGSNSNGDKEIMQKFSITGTGGIYTIMGLFGRKSNVSNSSMVGKLYTVDAITHGPDSLINYTDPLTMNDIDTNSVSGLFTTFQFAGEIFVGDSFFASIELPSGIGDSMAIYMTPNNCYSGHQLAYVKKSNGNFIPLNGGAGTYGLNADYWIWPVFIPDSIVGLSSISMRELSLYRAFPNPSENSVIVKFSIKTPTVIWIDFVNDYGQIIETRNLGLQLSGLHSISIDVSQLPAANYYYSIATPTERLFSRVSVVHH